MDPYKGKSVIITAEVVEYLKYGKQEWFDLVLGDGKKITINKKYCKIINGK